MGRFIVSVLDFLCIAAIVLFSVAGFVVGGKFVNPYGPFQLHFAIGYGLAAFLVGTIVFGAVLALTEIAKNTRRMIKLLEEGRRQA
jgi:uncharacterized membrane protein